ncbi:amino acid adenylation domain-containing protein [Streptomyces sp. NPDC088196]|uniref:non-ribosomal peptide synthetase n=1 Tax=Streptomyces sp. NPDC088196 TaxID=3154868 RepID=UPI00344B248B
MSRIPQAGPEAGPQAARRAQVRSLLQGARAAQRGDAAATAIPAAGPGVPVASYSQERMWLLEQMMPGYNTSTVIRVRGALDVDVLARSFTVVAGRHEVLRTVFDERDGAPVPRVLPAAPVPVPVHEAVGANADERHAAGVELARELMREPFSLSDGPVFRVAVVRLAEDDALLVLVVHHIAIDGTSMRVLWSELSRAYEALAIGREPELPPLPVQYGDYAAWSRVHLTPERLRHQLDHWREQLAGASADELPTDRPRPAVRTGNGAQFSFAVDGELGAAVNRFSREHNATAFMTLTAAFSVVLARHCAAREVTLGTPVAGRVRPELDGLIGYFVNTLLIRTQLADDPSFEALLARTRADTIASYEHQELPFEALLKELQPERDPSRNPLFQVLFSLGDEETDDLVLPGLATERVDLIDGKSRFDLTVALTRAGDTFTGVAYYESDLFEPGTISRLMRHFVTFLRNALANPAGPVSRVGMVDEGERDHLLAAGLGESVMFPEGSLGDLVDGVAVAAPDAAAVTDSETTLSYGELTGRANHLAGRLRAAGVAADTPVGLWMDRSVEMAVTLLAIVKAGGAFLPLDPDLPVSRAVRLLTDAGAPVVCVDGQRAESLAGTALTVLDCGPGTLTESAPTAPDSGVTGDNLVSVYYTSGSTGTPKGVASTHAGWTNRMQWMQAQYPLAPGESVLHKTVLSFDDSAVEIFWPLLAGATVVMLPPGLHRDPRAIADWSARHDIVALHFVPSMLVLFLDEITPARQPFTRLRHVISSGEALRPDLVAAFHERLAGTPARLHNQWGATEVSIDSTSHTCVPQDERAGEVPLGEAIANNQVLLLDEHFNPVPDGVPGDLYLAGAGLARGYLGDARKTAAAFPPHPFADGRRLYRTGDRGIRRPDGSLTFLGRADSQVKIRGIRIEPAEIEHTLRRHPQVRDAVVTKWEPTPGDHRLAAYITTEHTGDQDDVLVSLNAHLSDQLPLYMIPSSITVLDRIPVNANGKTDYRALPQPKATAQDTTTRASGAAEELVAGIWAEVLDRPDLDVHANFFALGGHSLLATRIVSRLRTALSPDIPLALIFDNPTIHTMAEAVGHLLPASGTADGRTPR